MYKSTHTRARTKMEKQMRAPKTIKKKNKNNKTTKPIAHTLNKNKTNKKMQKKQSLS